MTITRRQRLCAVFVALVVGAGVLAACTLIDMSPGQTATVSCSTGEIGSNEALDEGHAAIIRCKHSTTGRNNVEQVRTCNEGIMSRSQATIGGLDVLQVECDATTTTTTAPTTTTTLPPFDCPFFDSVMVTPSEDLAAVMATKPPGTTFCLQGVYNVHDLKPEDGDIFRGRPTATFFGDGHDHPVLNVTPSGASAEGIDFYNMTMTGYTPGTDRAVIETGDQWQVINSTVAGNDGIGIGVDGSWSVNVQGSVLHHNTQYGLLAVDSDDLTVHSTIVHTNNQNLDYTPTVTGGGMKFLRDNDTTVSFTGGWDNGGDCAWFRESTDVWVNGGGNCGHSVVGAGWRFDASFGEAGRTQVATAEYNDGPGFLVEESSGFTLDVVSRYNVGGGIMAYQRPRSDVSGTHETKNLHVQGSVVTMGDPDGTTRAVALISTIGGAPFTGAWGNTIEDTDYLVPAWATNAVWFEWNGAYQNWTDWQAFGHDDTGSWSTYP